MENRHTKCNSSINWASTTNYFINFIGILLGLKLASTRVWPQQDNMNGYRMQLKLMKYISLDAQFIKWFNLWDVYSLFIEFIYWVYIVYIIVYVFRHFKLEIAFSNPSIKWRKNRN